MLPSRKRARERLNSINTISELDGVLADLRLKDEEREVAKYVLGRCWTLQKTAMHLGYSKSQVKRIMSKVYDRIA